MGLPPLAKSARIDAKARRHASTMPARRGDAMVAGHQRRRAQAARARRASFGLERRRRRASTSCRARCSAARSTAHGTAAPVGEARRARPLRSPIVDLRAGRRATSTSRRSRGSDDGGRARCRCTADAHGPLDARHRARRACPAGTPVTRARRRVSRSGPSTCACSGQDALEVQARCTLAAQARAASLDVTRQGRARSTRISTSTWCSTSCRSRAARRRGRPASRSAACVSAQAARRRPPRSPRAGRRRRPRGRGRCAA